MLPAVNDDSTDFEAQEMNENNLAATKTVNSKRKKRTQNRREIMKNVQGRTTMSKSWIKNFRS
ncbi:hypothetical protein KUTeg_021917 [Tegillarca granosa]|uniref:Uncharacterized protein n=1 Tax=Tegillarca granosa TaxID=220873 RepID=A0ABQ9E4R2_TEGGR|nr:hypothetical protein KUTeg_021917 [Tegillarca granosa]